MDTIRITVTFEEQTFKHTALSEKISIGRSSKCDFSIPLEELSREHCIIEYREGSLYITDAGSKNGTELNNIRLIPQHKTLIPPNSTIKLSRLYSLKVDHIQLAGQDRLQSNLLKEGLDPSSTVTVPLELSENFRKKKKKSENLNINSYLELFQ